jgi:DNA mismatch repair protein MSH5
MARSSRGSSSSRGQGRGSSRWRGGPRQRRPGSSGSARSFPNSFRRSGNSQGERTRTPSDARSSVATSIVSHQSTPAPAAAQHPLPSRSEIDEELLDHIIVAVDVKESGDIGCAYYVAREERLFCMEDAPKGGTDILERCKSINSVAFDSLADKIQ